MADLNNLLEISEKVFEAVNSSSNSDMGKALAMLGNHLENPQSFTTLVGETSSGKSSLINAWLKRKLLDATASPTTGTVTWITAGEPGTPEIYSVMDRDLSLSDISLAVFKKLSMKPDKSTLRLLLQIPAPAPEFAGLNVFDTPGYNSISAEHEEILRDFLPESDVIVFVVNYRVGFGFDDQELMATIADISARQASMPVLLVINRCPAGATLVDKRIQEIRLHAEDTLHRSVIPFLVESSMPDQEGHSTLPKTQKLWSEVAHIVNSEQRENEFFDRAKYILNNLLSQRQNEIQAQLDICAANSEETKAVMAELIADSQSSYQRALVIVDKYMERLNRQIPKIVEQQGHELQESLLSEISHASKWVDAGSCLSYVSAHGLPFGVKNIIRQVENYVETELMEMDKELNEEANTVVKTINDRAVLSKSPELAKVLANAALRLSTTLAGAGLKSMTSSMSGIGGAAAGVGNLVKHGLKGAGKLVGHTFSRETYKTIGKVFTKKMLARLNVAVTVLVELISWVWEANTWQEKLQGEISENIDGWISETMSEIEDSIIPELAQYNKKGLKEMYAASEQELKDDADKAGQKLSPGKIKELKESLAVINEGQNELEALSYGNV